MVVYQGSALPVLTFPKSPRQLLHPQLCSPLCPGPRNEPQAAKAQSLPLQEDKLLEQHRIYQHCLFTTKEGSADGGKYLPWDYGIKEKNKLHADPNQRKELAQIVAKWDFKFNLWSSTILSKVAKRIKSQNQMLTTHSMEVFKMG